MKVENIELLFSTHIKSMIYLVNLLNLPTRSVGGLKLTTNWVVFSLGLSNFRQKIINFRTHQDYQLISE